MPNIVVSAQSFDKGEDSTYEEEGLQDRVHGWCVHVLIYYYTLQLVVYLRERLFSCRYVSHGGRDIGRRRT